MTLAAGTVLRHGAGTRHPHVSLTVPLTVPNDEEWCSVAEAARRLNVTPTAIRNRIKRRTLETKPNGNQGWLVRVPKPLPSPITLTVSESSQERLAEPLPPADERLIEAKDEHIQDLQKWLSEARQDLAGARQETEQERQKFTDLSRRVDLLQQQRAADQAELAKLRTELEQARQKRSWLERLLGR